MWYKPIRDGHVTVSALDGEQGSPSAHLNYTMTTDSPVTDGSASPDLLHNFTWLFPAVLNPGSPADGPHIFGLVRGGR